MIDDRFDGREQPAPAAAAVDVRQLLAASRETERRRVARELHDEVIQSLVVISQRLDHPTPPHLDDRDWASLRSDLRQALASARGVCVALRSPVLDTVGLMHALRSQIEAMARRVGLAAEFRVVGTPDRPLPGPIAQGIYRTAREALTNVERHSAASNVEVRLSLDASPVLLMVRDDGRGFNLPRRLDLLLDGEHFGLVGMLEQAELTGGSFLISSSQGQGTFCAASFPVPEWPNRAWSSGRRQAPVTGHDVGAVGPRGHPSLRVVIADDHPIVRAGIVRALSHAPDMTIVAEAADGDRALDLVFVNQPDVLLFDLKMPGMPVLEIVRRLKASGDGPPVVILSAFGDAECVAAALTAGALGYVLKDDPPENLIEAIWAVARGERWVSQSAASALVAQAIGLEPSRPTPPLSTRELQVMRLVVSGQTNQEIGVALGISPKTVQKHLRAVFTKFGVVSRVEAAVRMVRDDLV